MASSDRFMELQLVLKRKHLTQKDLVPVLGKESLCGISNRMNEVTPWQLDEMYAVLAFLRIPASEIHTYFPPKGVETS